MKIVIDDCNDYTKYFHTDVLLSADFECVPGIATGIAKNLLEAVRKIHGIQTVSVDRYKVRIERTKAVAWDQIIPQVEQIIRSFDVRTIGG